MVELKVETLFKVLWEKQVAVKLRQLPGPSHSDPFSCCWRDLLSDSEWVSRARVTEEHLPEKQAEHSATERQWAELSLMTALVFPHYVISSPPSPRLDQDWLSCGSQSLLALRAWRSQSNTSHKLTLLQAVQNPPKWYSPNRLKERFYFAKKQLTISLEKYLT